MRSLRYTILFVVLVIASFSISAQEQFVKLNNSEKIEITAVIDDILTKYTKINSFSTNRKFDMNTKITYLSLFEERADVINDFSVIGQKIKIEEYANVISLKMSEVSNEIVYFPYARKILLDSVRFDKLDQYYQIPVKIKKVLNYSLDVENNLQKIQKDLNLKIFVNVYKNSENVKIAGIIKDKTKLLWKDCEGALNGTTYIYSNCDDGNNFTTNDIYSINCTCAGTPFDCEGVENGNAVIGAVCDDENEKTQNDAYNENCVCAGFCNEDNTKTIGDICDDGNDTTVNDVYNENCLCKGSTTDCLGVEGGDAVFGSPCDDSNDATNYDVFNNNCECIGYFIDCEGLKDGTATIGSPCNDGNDKTINDIYKDDCTCAGEPLDCEGLPNGPYMPGYECDDKDKNTINDKYQEDCTCAGEPVAPNDNSKFGIYVGPIVQLPASNTANSANLKYNFGVGAKLGIVLTPHANKRLQYHLGAAYLPFDISGELDSMNLTIPTENNNKSYVLKLKPFKEEVTFTTVQIPVGLSYDIVDQTKTKLAIEVFAKPHLVLTNTVYQLNGNLTKYPVYDNFGMTPLLLIDYKESNEVMENTTEDFPLPQSKSTIDIKTPIALSGGLSLSQQIGNQNLIRFYAHYNYFTESAFWQPIDESINLESSPVINSLIQNNEIPGEINAPMSAYIIQKNKETLQNYAAIELGIIYVVKF